jgi:hypothetical protein
LIKETDGFGGIEVGQAGAITIPPPAGGSQSAAPPGHAKS